MFNPEKDVHVKSKMEYILYRYLSEAQTQGLLKFNYEEDLPFKSGFTIHPDFTIRVGTRKYFWEHLGELDRKKYYCDWQNRKNKSTQQITWRLNS